MNRNVRNLLTNKIRIALDLAKDDDLLYIAREDGSHSLQKQLPRVYLYRGGVTFVSFPIRVSSPSAGTMMSLWKRRWWGRFALFSYHVDTSTNDRGSD